MSNDREKRSWRVLQWVSNSVAVTRKEELRLAGFVERVKWGAMMLGSCLVVATVGIAWLFGTQPAETSDFFGYYYRFNVPGESKVLAATTGPEAGRIQTSVMADVLKPVAAVSLVVVKAVDGQKYDQIVTKPVAAAEPGLPGRAGSDGRNGGRGLAGPAGANGKDGKDGKDGSDAVVMGLTTAHFSSANISQWTNNSGYITSSSTDTLTNKTISGASNTLSNIGNAALSNSSVTINAAGINTGGGAVALGGNVTITGTEADTLAAVTGRGANTNTAITLGGGLTLSSLSTGVVHSNSSGVLSSSTVALASEVSGVLPIANGGTNNSSAYTAGSVVFSNGTALTQDNSGLFWDDANDRLGIGTAAPGRTLDVVGNWGGNVVVDNRTLNSSQTITVSTKALMYHLTNDTGTGSSATITFNITGLPDTDGAFAFIYTAATDNSLTSASTVVVQVNGVQVSTVASPALTAATVIESYTLVRTNSTWKIIGTPGTADTN